MATAQLVYSLACDDVRLEMGNKLSLMGIFENLFFPGFPSMILKLSVANHWVGVGEFQTQVRVLAPDGREIASSGPSKFRIETDGYADNISFFTNVTFDRAGRFTIQTSLDGKVVSEKHIYVHLIQQPPSTVN
ncbi:MAG TPA: hypothetical protein VFO86_03950 [Terriglobia bacterium]|nr:hypothetical protein [Terriglobia bacterium]